MNAYIKAISYYLPEKIVTNEELVKEFPEWSVEKVAKKIGVNERHISAENETAGDMAVKAAEKLFSEYAITPEEIDFILLCTQSPDYVLPTTACLIQTRLNIPTTCGALDYNLGCSGFVYGLSLAKGLLLGDVAKNVLLLTSETYNKHIHPDDKGNRSLFGDAASATLISTSGFAEIGSFSLGTDGRGADNLIIRTGGCRSKAPMRDLNKDESGALYSSDHLYMNGSEIFNFTLDSIPPLIERTLQVNNTNMENIGLVVLHQANKFMLDTIRKVSGIEKEKYYINMEDTGNTVSSTIPIALKKAILECVIDKGNSVLIAGFGVGYSWGGNVLKF